MVSGFHLGRSRRVWGISSPTPLNFAFSWEDQEGFRVCDLGCRVRDEDEDADGDDGDGDDGDGDDGDGDDGDGV